MVCYIVNGAFLLDFTSEQDEPAFLILFCFFQTASAVSV